MADRVRAAGVELAYTERGAGPATLLIHGMAGDAAAFAGVLDALSADRRVIAYDRRGYGESEAPEPYEGTTVEEQAEDAVALLRGLGATPALVLGDGFGALVALDLLKRHVGVVRAAVLSNPPLFAFVPESTEVLAAQRAELEDALRAGGPEAAVERWLGGRIAGDELARARRAHRAFFADYVGLASWPITRRELRALATPAVVVTGPWSPPHVTAAADVLAELMPGATRMVDGDLVGAARLVEGS
jgi:pimeloyl-ACP methyl ester carboxylesterase